MTERTVRDMRRHPVLAARRILTRLGAGPVRGVGRVTNAITRAIPLPSTSGPCRIDTAHGVSLIVDPARDRHIERDLFASGTYEAGTLALLAALLRPGATFFDVGANIGLMTTVGARAVGEHGRVVAFEPVPETVDLLRENVRLNGFDNVIVVPAGLGRSVGRARIAEAAGARGSTSLTMEATESAAGSDVALNTLDAASASFAPRGIDVVKIDVEGWELEVLRGAAETLAGDDPPAFIVEASVLTTLEGGTRADLFAVFSDPYRVFRLARGKGRPSPLVEIKRASELPDHDNIVCLRPAHLDILSGGPFC